MYIHKSHNNLSNGARAGVIAAVVIVVAGGLAYIGWFMYRNRKIKYTKELAETQEGIQAWPTKFPTRSRPTTTSTQSRNRHGEPVELAPPVYDVAHPLPSYEAPRLDQDAPESYEMGNMSQGPRSARQDVYN